MMYFVIGIRCGLASTSLHTLPSRVVRRSQILSCLWWIRPPFRHISACSTLKGSPQGQVDGRLSNGRLYLSLKASLNSSLFRRNCCSCIGKAFNQLLAPCPLLVGHGVMCDLEGIDLLPPFYASWFDLWALHFDAWDLLLYPHSDCEISWYPLAAQ